MPVHGSLATLIARDIEFHVGGGGGGQSGGGIVEGAQEWKTWLH